MRSVFSIIYFITLVSLWLESSDVFASRAQVDTTEMDTGTYPGLSLTTPNVAICVFKYNLPSTGDHPPLSAGGTPNGDPAPFRPFPQWDNKTYIIFNIMLLHQPCQFKLQMHQAFFHPPNITKQLNQLYKNYKTTEPSLQDLSNDLERAILIKSPLHPPTPTSQYRRCASPAHNTRHLPTPVHRPLYVHPKSHTSARPAANLKRHSQKSVHHESWNRHTNLKTHVWQRTCQLAALVTATFSATHTALPPPMRLVLPNTIIIAHSHMITQRLQLRSISNTRPLVTTC